jgi:hypothetical protein
MKPVFADTSYYVALLGPRDAWHDRAVEMSGRLLGRVFGGELVSLHFSVVSELRA